MSETNQTAGILGYLTYISSAVDRFDQPHLKQLLAVARRNNTLRDITGLLLYRDGRFLQYLEGPQITVKAVYRHIRKDVRHTSARVVSSGTVEGRMFPRW